MKDWISFAICMLIFGMLAFYVADRCTGTYQHASARVISREHVRERITWTWMSDGKRGGHPQPVHLPDRWDARSAG